MMAEGIAKWIVDRYLAKGHFKKFLEYFTFVRFTCFNIFNTSIFKIYRRSKTNIMLNNLFSKQNVS